MKLIKESTSTRFGWYLSHQCFVQFISLLIGVCLNSLCRCVSASRLMMLTFRDPHKSVRKHANSGFSTFELDVHRRQSTMSVVWASASYSNTRSWGQYRAIAQLIPTVICLIKYHFITELWPCVYPFSFALHFVVVVIDHVSRDK